MSTRIPMTTIMRLPALTLCAAGVLLACASIANATPIANKFVFSSQFGWDVNQTAVETTGATQAEENLCTAISKDVCQSGQDTTQTGGFGDTESVAVDNDPGSPAYGDVYVLDPRSRVQVFTAAGVFVSVFGWDVNKTEVEAPGATQAEKNVCTAASSDTCQAGTQGEEPGQIAGGFSLASDPATGDIYLAEGIFDGERGVVGFRVQAFTAAGAWLFEIGQEVNATTKGNLCTQQEAERGTRCKGPTLIPYRASPSGEHGAFSLGGGYNLLAVGGPEDLLYVGGASQVQEFTASGEWKSEISLESLSAPPEYKVQALAVDEAGNVYLTYGATYLEALAVVHELNPTGAQIGEFEVAPVVEGGERFYVRALAIDPHGRLAVAARSLGFGQEVRDFIYSSGWVRISEFGGNPNAFAFAASDELYDADAGAQDVEVFAPALFPEAVTCPAGAVGATSAMLCGQLDANGLQARGFFVYGPPAGSRTPVAFEGDSSAFEPVSWDLTGLVPDQTYSYALGAEAQVNGEPVTGDGEQLTFHTATAPPEVPGAPSAADVTGAFAVLSASVNPQHAPTRYHFEYGPCPALSGCAHIVATEGQESSAYGTVGAAQEAVGLQPATLYSYRLVADNEHEEAGHVQGGTTSGVEGHFTTAASPVPAAQTGGASGVGVTSATASGLVDPDGAAAVYAFELGIDRGAGTQFGIAFSGQAGAGVGFSAVQQSLTGLQSGTTYAYRVTISSGYGRASGAVLTFTTEGLPAVLPVTLELGMLSTPSVLFPGEATAAPKAKGKKAKGKTTRSAVRCKRGARRSGGRCVKTRRKQHNHQTTTGLTGRR